MKWLSQLWQSIAHPHREYQGVNGLWLATQDVKAAAGRLTLSREHLSNVKQRQAHAVDNLRNTIRELKENKRTPTPAIPNRHEEKDGGGTIE